MDIWVWSILATVVYLMAGAFIVGFMDVDADRDSTVFFGVVSLWPVVLVALILVVVFGTPWALGKKLGRRYLERFNDFINHIFNN